MCVFLKVLCFCFFVFQDSPGDTFLNGNPAGPTGPLFLERTYLLDEYSFSEDVCCPHGHMSGKAGPNATHCGPGEDFPVLSLVSEDYHFRQIPMEDEYMDRTPHGPRYLPLLSQPESKPVSPFSEPVEVGENDSLSQCFTGTESLEELANCYCTDASCGIDPSCLSSHNCLQNSCHPLACGSARDLEHHDLGASLSVPGETNSCTACRGSCRESPGKPGNAAGPFKESGPPPLGACDLDSSFVDQTSSADDTSARNDPCDAGGTKNQNTKKAPESNRGTSNAPAASGKAPPKKSSCLHASVRDHRVFCRQISSSESDAEGVTTVDDCLCHEHPLDIRLGDVRPDN